MKKKYLILITVVLLCLILATFIACDYEKKYVEKLQNLGYEVKVSEKLYTSDYKDGCIRISAYKIAEEVEEVYILVFDNKDDAKRCYNELISEGSEELSFYLDGKVVISGTAQGVNDARS